MSETSAHSDSSDDEKETGGGSGTGPASQRRARRTARSSDRGSASEDKDGKKEHCESPVSSTYFDGV